MCLAVLSVYPIAFQPLSNPVLCAALVFASNLYPECVEISFEVE